MVRQLGTRGERIPAESLTLPISVFVPTLRTRKRCRSRSISVKSSSLNLGDYISLLRRAQTANMRKATGTDGERIREALIFDIRSLQHVEIQRRGVNPWALETSADSLRDQGAA